MADVDPAKLLVKLRGIVNDSIAKQSYTTAQFWADKVATLSDSAPQDVYLLAQTCYLTSQYHRAAFLLTKSGLLDHSTSCRCLASKCHIACQEWEKALEVLGEHPEVDEVGAEADDAFEGAMENARSAVSLLRGTIYEALDHRDIAVSCYERALKHDVYCFEAFDKLMSHHMLSSKSEQDLLTAMPFDKQCDEHADLIRYLYASKMKKYEAAPETIASYIPPTALLGNAELMVSQAERMYTACDFRRCYQITTSVLDSDPFHHACLPIHLACQVELRDEHGLFYTAHKLVDSYADKPISWFAVGCYYYLIGNNESARKFFGRASQLDIHFGAAWIGFGHSFAAEGEHDQAMAAYCTSARLMSGCHLPLLFIGMEYVVTNNPGMAQQYFTQAYAISDQDPSVLHELGVIAFKTSQFEQAVAYFKTALTLLKEASNGAPLSADSWEVTLSNLARTLLKLGLYTDSIEMYRKALALSPRTPSIHAGLGFTHHCMGKLPEAIEWYHKALGLRAEDSFCAQMLKKALEEMSELPAILDEHPI